MTQPDTRQGERFVGYSIHNEILICFTTAKLKRKGFDIVKKFYDYLCGRDRIDQSGGAVLRVTGDRSIPLINDLLDLYVR